jgi:hypothetical protein
MLTGIHILLTYGCIFECDHCFLYCSPRSEGTFTAESLRRGIEQAKAVRTVTTVCFEGGEPLLYLPLLLAGIAHAKTRGLQTGMVTNGYTARSEEDGELLLHMLKHAGLDSVTVSSDRLHFGEEGQTPAAHLLAAAARLGFPAGTIVVEQPSPEAGSADVMFRGRAADRMVEGLPRKPWGSFDRCPHEDPRDPARVHVDCYGNVLFCQGISMGNAWEKPLAALFQSWDPDGHPICGPLAAGGPAELARRYGVCTDGEYVDACHLCFETRRRLLQRFPLLLVPAQVYGPPAGPP